MQLEWDAAMSPAPRRARAHAAAASTEEGEAQGGAKLGWRTRVAELQGHVDARLQAALAGALHLLKEPVRVPLSPTPGCLAQSQRVQRGERQACFE